MQRSLSSYRVSSASDVLFVELFREGFLSFDKYEIFFKGPFLFSFVCVCAYMSHMCKVHEVKRGGQIRGTGVIGGWSHLIWMLGIDFKSSERAARGFLLLFLLLFWAF